MRADRLVSMALLLQARGRTPASVLASELEVCVRTVYRDLAALNAAGVPVVAESGPGGGCYLLDGYRFPLGGLRPEEAEALLILGVPAALGELGLDGILATAHHSIRATAGGSIGASPRDDETLVHLDMPRWFASTEQVPHLRTLAEAVRQRRQLRFRYRDSARAASPLGLVNKAGTWYLVALAGRPRPTVFRVARITLVRLLADPVERPGDFQLAAFWDEWSAEFIASRPQLAVRVRVSARAVAIFPEILGDSVLAALDTASAPDDDGWRIVTLTFDNALAAAHRLAGFGDLVEVLSPPEVRDRLIMTAEQILGRYQPTSASRT